MSSSISNEIMFHDLYQKYDLCVGESTNGKLLKNIAQLEEISYFTPSKINSYIQP